MINSDEILMQSDKLYAYVLVINKFRRYIWTWYIQIYNTQITRSPNREYKYRTISRHILHREKVTVK